MKIKENIKEENELNLKVYEIGYLLVPTLSEEETPAIYSSIKDLILSFKGEIIMDEMPKMISLAYTMIKTINNINKKFDSAYFGWVKFEMDASDLLKLKEKLDLDINILRFLAIKTVRENTIAPKKLISKEGGMRKKTFTAKKDGTEDIVLPIDEVQIDKEIEAMVEGQ